MEIVSFEIAKKLKEKGFRELCTHFYRNGTFTPQDMFCGLRRNTHLEWSFNSMEVKLKDTHKRVQVNIVDAPTISQVLKWLREKRNIFVAINIAYCYESNEIPFPTNPKMEPILKGYYYGIWELDNLNDKNGRSEYFETPELAVLAGVEYCLDNLI